MRRVQGDQAELAIPHVGGDALGVSVGERGVFDVPPPNYDIRRIKCSLIEPLLGRVKVRGLYGDAGLRTEMRGDGFTKKLVPVSLFLLRLLLVPDKHANRFRAGGLELNGGRQREGTKNREGLFHGMRMFFARMRRGPGNDLITEGKQMRLALRNWGTR